MFTFLFYMCVCVHIYVHTHTHIYIYIYFFFFAILGPHPWHMDVPRLGVYSELQPLAYARATATWDPSHVCNLHHSSWQRRILNPLSKARDQTCVLMDTSQIPLHWATMGTHDLSWTFIFLSFFFFLFFLDAPMACGRSPGPGIDLSPQQQPEPQQWQCWVFNLLSHRGTPIFLPF